jgi:hypothetical protein
MSRGASAEKNRPILRFWPQLRRYGATRWIEEAVLLHHMLVDALIAGAFVATFASGYGLRALTSRPFRRDGFW